MIGFWRMWCMLVVFAAVLGLLVLIGRCGYLAAARCTDNGGAWVDENCHPVEGQVCVAMTGEVGVVPVINSICVPTTSTVCDRVCRGVRPEAEPASPASGGAP